MTEAEQKALSKREVVVVLGVGRSGTSLAMQALKNLGVRVSENLIPPDVSNPRGFYEDADIVEIHKNLLSALATSPAMPLPEGWMNRPEAKRALKELKAIVEANVSQGQGPWAFKDPRTATFLPLWILLFNQLKIVPRFILAVRRPEAVIESFAQQYGNDQAFAELIYLQRTLDALHYTSTDCFILSYERWFEGPAEALQEMAEFVFQCSTDIEGVELPVLQRLKRSSDVSVSIQTPLVKELYGIIAAFDRDASLHGELVACVRRLRAILWTFEPWWVFAARQKALHLECQGLLRESNTELRELAQYKGKKVRAVLASSEYKNAFLMLERVIEIE